MKRIISWAMIFALVSAMSSSAMASVIEVNSHAYAGVTAIPTYDVTIHQYSDETGTRLILNPYTIDVQSGGQARWVKNNDKTLEVISRPTWVENKCDCAVNVSVLNYYATVSNSSITIANKTLTKATATKQVFLYLCAVAADGESSSQPEDDAVSFPAYSRASNQLMLTGVFNNTRKTLMKLPASSASGSSTWGAVKICGNASGLFTNPAISWQSDDIVDVNFVLDIQMTAP